VGKGPVLNRPKLATIAFIGSLGRIDSMATVRLRIGPADHGRRMTLEEFGEAEEQPGYLYELARGVLEVSEVPGDAHWQIVDNLHEAFSLYRRQHPGIISRIGHGSDVRFIIPELVSDRHPDLGILLQGDPLDDRGWRRPSLVVEVVSPGKAAHRRDYETKREEYLALGLREYWIIDPRLRQVTVLVRREGPGGPIWDERVFRGDDVVVSDLLPGFAGTVAELWVDAEGDEDDADGHE
jgi:Uma2 family endonuclease